MKKILTIVFVFTGIPSMYSQEKHVTSEQDANEWMSRFEVEELSKTFDSPGREEWQKPEEVIGLFGDLTGKTVVDLGAGSGYFTFRLARIAKKVIAADVDEKFLDVLRSKYQWEEYSGLKDKIEIRKIPYDDPGLDDGEADGLIVVNTYHHIHDRINYFRKVKKGLKEGARLIIVDYKTEVSFGPPLPHKINMNTVLEEIREAGFRNITTHTALLQYQYVVTAEK